MTGSLLRVYIVVFLMSLVSSAYLKLNRRSTAEGQFDGPCFTTIGDGQTESRPLAESLGDLKTRTAGLKHDAEILKDFLKEHYQISDINTQQLDLMYWMNPEDMFICETTVTAAISKPNEAFKSHYQLLSVYSLYVEQLRTNGTIAEKKSEEETRKKIYDFEVKLHNCICSLNITLQSSGSDVSSNVTSDVLDPNFLAYSSPLTNAAYRAYITMKDGVHMMDFLNTIYLKIEESIVN